MEVAVVIFACCLEMMLDSPVHALKIMNLTPMD